MEHFDIAIIGAGPAGSTCALALGKSGLKVVIIDKSEFPRDKVCGDATAAYVPKVLNTIDPVLKESFLAFTKKEPVDTVRIYSEEGKHLDLQFKEFGNIVRRIDLDNFLIEEVRKLQNTTLFLGQKVSELVRQDDGFLIVTDKISITTKLVVGCDGAQGITRKCLSPLKKDPEHYAAAVRGYYKNVVGIPKGTFELHYLKGYAPGYFWIFPLADGTANVGLGMSTDQVSKNNINLTKGMEDIIANYPGIKERFENAELEGKIEGYGLPLGSRKVPLSGDGFMFCGDAGCLIEPLTGEGIGQAMVSGRYAGWQAIECFKQKNFSASFMKKYDKAVYDKLWKDHSRRLKLRNLIEKHPKLFNRTIAFASKNNWVNNLIQKMLW